MSAFHLDAGFTPLFPFGFGLSYTRFEYSDVATSADRITLGETIEVSAKLRNAGAYEAEEVVQLYVRDLVGDVTRPVRELKGFKRVRLQPGGEARVVFTLHSDDLAFYNRRMMPVTEPGTFHVWIGGSSDDGLWSEFVVVEAPHHDR